MKLFIFGATGDLVGRYVGSALRTLGRSDLDVIALGRRDLSSLDVDGFPVKYEKVSFEGTLVCDGCEAHLAIGETTYFYSALPPAQIEQVVRYVGTVKRDGYPVKLLLEKPFGENLRDAEKLKELLIAYDLSDDTLLADHYLWKDGIKDLKPTIFKTFNFVSLDDFGVGNRIEFYDRVGALHDVVQNHGLNTAFKLLENPSLDFKDFEVKKFVRKQYEGYKEELGRASDTETFVDLEISLTSRTLRFVAGKNMQKKERYIEVDGERKELGQSNSYEGMLADFLDGRKAKFPTVDQAILAWQIIERVEKQKPPLEIYKVPKANY